MKLTCSYDGARAARDLLRLGDQAHAAMVNELRQAADETAVQAAADSPVDTGRYQDSWQVEQTADGAVLVNTAPYAEHVAYQPTLPDNLETRAADAFRRVLESP